MEYRQPFHQNSDQSNSNKKRRDRGLRVEVKEGLAIKQTVFDSTLLGREGKRGSTLDMRARLQGKMINP